jgi:hypothetical protein
MKRLHQTIQRSFLPGVLVVTQLLCSVGARSATAISDTVISPFSGPPDDIGPDHRSWATIDPISGAPQHRIVEIATGMNFWNGQSWLPSDSTFSLTNGDFVASRLQHKVSISADDLNVAGAVNVRTPDGLMVSSTPSGIGLYDAASGQFLLVGTLTNCSGAQVGTNQVVFENAFAGVCATVVFTVEQHSFAQDIVFTGDLNPADYGFPTNTTRIQIISELYNPPAPDIITHPLYVEQNPAVRQQMASPDLMDETIGFGEFVLGTGLAFTPPTPTQPKGTSAYVAKEFTTISNRTFLIESIQYSAIAAGLRSLPPCSAAGGRQASLHTTHLKAAYAALPRPPEPAQANATPGRPPRLAKRAAVPRGVEIDYIGTIGGNLNANPTVFQSFTNYFVSGPVFVNGSAVIEGGTIFKYKVGAYLQFASSITWKGSQLRPVVFTGVDDDTVGDSLINWTNSGYTGVINTNGYANPAISANFTVTVSNACFRYAQIAIANNGDPSGMTLTVAHSQFFNCIQGINLTYNGSGTGAQATVNVNNALMVNTKYPIVFTLMYDTTCTLANCTVDQSAQLLGGDGSAGIFSYNSIYANISTLGPGGCYGHNNGFYSTPVFGSAYVQPSNYPFQTVGAGSHYLTNSSGLQGAGVTNNVPASLLSDLKLRTTYPPLVIANAIITTNLVLQPTAQRDTNTTHPDLGYHYDPIDYALGFILVTNATVTLTNPATVVATFGTNGGSYGLGIGQNAQLLSLGTPNQPNWIVQFNTVQEQPGSPSTWYRTTNGLVISEFQGLSPQPVINCRFTDWSVLGLDAPAFYAPTNLGPINFQDCEFHGGKLLSFGPTVNLTNALLERVYTDLEPTDTLVSYYRNALVFGGMFSVAPTNSVIEANLFDRAWITNYIGSRGNTYSGGFNAYVIPTNYGRLYPTNSGDVILTASPTYYKGKLGAYYEPTTSSLINADTSHTADQVALYHYTVVTNFSGSYEIKETNSSIDIGYHYIALGTNGLPADSNGNGIPDYQEDPAGTGLLGPSITLISPANNAFYTEPATIPIQASVYDWSSIVTNVAFLRGGTITVTTFAGSPYQYSWPIVAAGQYALTGIASDLAGLSSTSAPVNVTVTNLCGH